MPKIKQHFLAENTRLYSNKQLRALSDALKSDGRVLHFCCPIKLNLSYSRKISKKYWKELQLENCIPQKDNTTVHISKNFRKVS